ncbi:MAG: hypothetical protein QOF96_4060, partial [Actinomycetota bacterium]|nr:hypothetical protein [Actinomycetota bacterium]
MKRIPARLAALAAVALVLSSSVPALSATAVAATAAPGRLSGIVRDNTGTAQVGSEVRVSTPSGPVAATATTDGAGRYSISVATGSYDLTVATTDAAGLYTAQLNGITVGADTALDIAVVPPPAPPAPPAPPGPPVPAVTFSGTLRDGNGRGVGAASITLAGPTTLGATTDSDGRFSLTAAAGTYSVSVTGTMDMVGSATGPYVRVRAGGLDLSTDRTLDLTLGTPVDVTVVVTDHAGSALPDALVGVSNPCPTCDPGFELFPGALTTGLWVNNTKTGPDGRAVLHGYAGPAAVAAEVPNPADRPPAYLPAHATVDLPAAGDVPLVLEADTAPHVSWTGRFIDSEGRPLGGNILIRPVGATTSADPYYQAGSDDFSFSVPPGHYRVELDANLGSWSDGYKSGDDAASDVSVTIPDVDLTHDRAGDLTAPFASFPVHAVDAAGQPVRVRIADDAHGPVELAPGVSGDGESRSNTVFTDPDGRASLRIFRGAPPATVSALDEYDTLATAAVPAGATSAEIVVDAPILEGTVRDARGPLTGSANNGAWVSFRSSPCCGQFAPWPYWTGQDGSYRLQSPAGDRTLYVSNDPPWPDMNPSPATSTLPGTWSFEAPYHVAANTTLDLTLPDATAADVLVADADGQPRTDVTLDYHADVTDPVTLAPGVVAHARGSDSLAGSQSHFAPLLFGPSSVSLVAYDSRDAVAVTTPMAPGAHLGVLTGDRTAPPSPPQDVTAIAGDGKVKVTWSAPASDGGSPVTGYVVTASHGGSNFKANVPASAASGAIRGLVNGNDYRITVAAKNRKGPGPASAPVTVT